MTENMRKYGDMMSHKQLLEEFDRLRDECPQQVDTFLSESRNHRDTTAYTVDVHAQEGIRAVCIKEPLWVACYLLADYNDSLKTETT